ncbi:MAG: sulfite oxidase-like oxidoreductase [Bryobacteraceae bacterium]
MAELTEYLQRLKKWGTSQEINKHQGDAVPAPEGLPADVIVSPDTRRTNRIPPGQSRTRKWPVLDAYGPPRIDLDTWQFRVSGLVGQPLTFTWAGFLQLPRVKVFSDFHCVTRWSRLGNLWEGVSTRRLVEMAGGVTSGAKYALAYGHDHGFTTNMPLDAFLAEDALVAVYHDGEPISVEHGGPARLIVPRLYAWKSAKWTAGFELMPDDRAGFWEENGYHMNGDPWHEERFR